MERIPHRFSVVLPEWLRRRAEPVRLIDPAERMLHVIALSAQNVREGTGGPFGAAVFDAASGDLVSVGVNLVTATGNSMAHAEIVALALAERARRTYDLGAVGAPTHELVTSAEPCVMCLGAVVWSGVRRVRCGARDADIRGIGFDEGPKPPDWVSALRARGIEVERDLLRAQAVAVLKEYALTGGVIYNARDSGSRD